MSFKKTLVAVTAVGALAGTAVPAMALENEFHGLYKMKYFVSNFDNGSVGNVFRTSGTDKVGYTSRSAMNYFEQRARLFYNAKANDDLKLVVAFEIDSIFGDKSQSNGSPTRNNGGALDTDAVNLETKWVHLDFNIPGVPTNVKVGTQAIKDSLKGIVFDVDAAGISTSTKIGTNATVNLGYYRGYEGNSGNTNGGASALGLGAKMGVNNLDLVALEGKYKVTKDLAVGLNYYGLFDYRDAAATMLDHTLGANVDANFGALNVSGFIAGQLGTIADRAGTNSFNGLDRNIDLSGIAANVAARLKVGPGTAKLAGLYTSGDDGKNANKNTAWQSLQLTYEGAKTIANPNTGSLNTYNESGMMLLNRNAAAEGTTTDRQIATTTNNNNQGMILLTAGYDANLTSKAYASANAGVLFAADNRNASANDTAANFKKPATGNGNLMGAEFNVEAGYKLYDNLTASVQGAYVVLGNYYNGTGLNDPYTFRTVLSYAF